MASSWHKQLTDYELGYRDYLAADRTRLANERTMLAYIRTGINCLIAGVSFIKFFNTQFFQITGLILISTGFVTAFIGLWKYLKMHRLIESVTQVKYTEEED